MELLVFSGYLRASRGTTEDVHRDYAAALRDAGAEPIVEMAAVFHGKKVWMRKARRSFRCYPLGTRSGRRPG